MSEAREIEYEAEQEKLIEHACKLPELLGDFDELLRAMSRNSNLSLDDLWEAAKGAAREDIEAGICERQHRREVSNIL